MLVPIYFAAAFAASLVLTPVCRALAQRYGFVARPKHDRWHKRPTALFGGVAIALVTLGLGLTLGLQPAVTPLLVTAAMIAAFGLVDDALSLKASTKLIAQVTAASVLLLFGFRLQWLDSMVGDAMLTLFWIVGVTNAFNLLDNMDGLCAGTALIAGTFLLIDLVGNPALAGPALYLAGLLGATAGFLVYNVYPASIFMGDTGSLLLGLNLAAISLVANGRDAQGRSGLLSVVAAPVLPLLVPIFDTTLVTALRVLSGRSPSQGGRDHSSHRLVAVGLSEPRAVATLWMLAAAGGMIAIVFRRTDGGWAFIAGGAFLLAMIIFGVYLARVRVYDDADLARLKGETLTPVIANFMYKRRVAEVLLDLCLIPLAYYSAYRLRFEGGPLFALNYPQFLQSLPVVLAAQLIALFVVGGYRGTWRYFGMMDAVVFGKGVIAGTVAAELGVLYLYRFESYSRSVFVIDAIILLLLLSATRASFRLVGEFVLRRTNTGRRVLIYGTTGASQATIREAFGSDVMLKIVGYIDDDPLKKGIRVGGYAVVGNSSDLLEILRRREVDCVVINTSLLDAGLLQSVEQICRDHDIELLRLQIHLRRLSAVS
jgi:UDP-GlcNAc:undecaprenyl-phosphate/decaprenyl-phosphate GlcNAc-1-phosphate transferase